MRYYFKKGKVKSKEVIIEYFPTWEILVDHFMKPLQGVLLRKFWAEIMNVPDDLDIGDMDVDESGIIKGLMWKLYNEIDPGCPHECVGDYENIRGGMDLRTDLMDTLVVYLQIQ